MSKAFSDRNNVRNEKSKQTSFVFTEVVFDLPSTSKQKEKLLIPQTDLEQFRPNLQFS